MITYIRHDQEFFASIKLKTGDEVLGECVATEEDGKTIIFISSPATPMQVPMEKGGEVGIGLTLQKWMMWSDEDFYIINEDDIVTIAPLSMAAIMMYKMWQRKENSSDEKDDDWETPMNENMGLVGKVSEMRKKLEAQWNKDKY